MFTKFLLCFGLFGTVLFLDLVSLSSADEQMSFDEQKLIVDPNLIDLQKIIDEAKFSNEQKPILDQRKIDVQKIIDETKFFNEQKPIFDQKKIDIQKIIDEAKIIDRLEIGCEEECLPPAECIIDQCCYHNVSNFKIPDDEIDNPESTLIHYAHSAHLIKVLYILVVAIIALVSCCCQLTRQCCSKSNEIPYEQDMLVAVESPQPPADGFQQPTNQLVYQPTDTTYSVNSPQLDLPPSYDNVVKPNADASSMNC